jgi:Ca2+/Na+ antiporter
MRESTKGVFLSALVYPGAGQMAMGSIFAGAVFIVLTTAGLLLIIYRITIRIYYSIDQILPTLASGALSMSSFLELISRAPYASWQIEGISLIIVLSCWVVSILHAYLIGRKIDRLPG